jgi:hypothetical protein
MMIEGGNGQAARHSWLKFCMSQGIVKQRPVGGESLCVKVMQERWDAIDAGRGNRQLTSTPGSHEAIVAAPVRPSAKGFVSSMVPARTVSHDSYEPIEVGPWEPGVADGTLPKVSCR